MLLGDARVGKLADNIAGFGRALRRAGVKVDSQRIGLAKEAALAVGIAEKEDLSAAFESVMISREQDRLVFRELLTFTFRTRKSPINCWRSCYPAPKARPSPASAARVSVRHWLRRKNSVNKPNPPLKTRRSNLTRQ